MQVNDSSSVKFSPLQQDPALQQTQRRQHEQQQGGQETADVTTEARVYNAQRETIAQVRKKPDMAATEQIKSVEEAQSLVQHLTATIKQDSSEAVTVQGNIKANNAISLIR